MIVAVDAGGTYLKSALVTKDGKVLEESFSQTPSHSAGTKSEIIRALSESIAQLLRFGADTGTQIEGIAFAYPGPFDYENGRCLMDHKYTSVYGVPLVPEIRREISLPELPVRFNHDMHAFAFGEYVYGAGKNASRLFCVSIGTGLGTGYIKDDVIVPREDGGPRFSIFSRSYRDGTLEDLVSARGIERKYRDLNGIGESTRETLDPKAIQLRAENGDSAALRTYSEAGAALGGVVGPIIRENEIDTLIFGGQISRAYGLFAPAFDESVGDVPSLRKTAVATRLNDASLSGAAALLRRSIVSP